VSLVLVLLLPPVVLLPPSPPPSPFAIVAMAIVPVLLASSPFCDCPLLFSSPQNKLLLLVAAPCCCCCRYSGPVIQLPANLPRDSATGTSTAEGRGPQRGGGDSSGLPRTGSVAPFVPQRADLTPAEGKAHFIMLPTTTPAADGDGGGGGGGSSSKQLTVFSEKGMLLGFYEEVSLGPEQKL